MRNLIHFYYQNKQKIWKIILIVMLIIAIIQILNNIAAQKGESNISINNSQKSNTVQIETSNTIISNDKSLVDGNQISTTVLKETQEIVDTFIKYCNEGKIDQAYDILTQECKEELYPTLDVFKNGYWKEIFETEKRTCTIENWTGSTYKVTIEEDILATGKVNNSNKYIEYMTIVKSEDTYKLNINNYIGRTEINRSTSKNNIEIKVISKDTYMDYEIYNIQVNNQTENDILLDDLSRTDTIYLQDTKGVNYDAYSYNLIKNTMLVNKGIKRNIEITFSNGYASNRKLKYLVFSKLILNYKENNNVETEKTMEFCVNL